MEQTLARCVELLSDERACAAGSLLGRWRGRSFLTLIVGEFKRGKSSLLNALLGDELLPTGVRPVTTVPTAVRPGARRSARVRFRDGSEREIALEQVRDYVDESRNPGNHLGVAAVEIEAATGLPPGVALVDIPGLGSIHRHNTEAALAALPEADAALLVASVDPPLGEAELRLLDQLRRHAARIEVVLNKVDYLDEEGRRAAEEFTRQALARHGFSDTPVWPVSARDGLTARLAHDDVGWRRSGMEALWTSLTRFLQEERESALARSLARKAGRLVEQELALIEIALAAADRSSRQLREIIEAFRARRATVARDSSEAVLIFLRRFEAIFSGYAERAAARWPSHRDELEARLRAIAAGAGSRSASARKEMEAAVRAAVDSFLEAFLPAESRHLAAAYARLGEEVARAAAERSEAIWRLAAELLSFHPPRVEPQPPAPIRLPSGLQLDSLRLLLDGLGETAARLLPRGLALRRLASRAMEEAKARYGRAVEQTREGFYRSYEKDFRSLLAQFEAAAEQTARGIETALSAAEQKAHLLAADASAAARDEERRASLRELQRVLREMEGTAC